VDLSGNNFLSALVKKTSTWETGESGGGGGKVDDDDDADGIFIETLYYWKRYAVIDVYGIAAQTTTSNAAPQHYFIKFRRIPTAILKSDDHPVYNWVIKF
jgi:hypothetical protein